MAKIRVINVVPQTHSNETNIDSEPSVAVNPANSKQILVSAFTPPDSGQTNGPLYVSSDGGATWNMAFIVPSGGPLDQTYSFGGLTGEFYGGDISGASDPFGGTIILNALSTADPFVPGTMNVLESPTPTDQPFIVATTVRYGPDDGKDRFYIGYNDQRVATTTGHTAAIDFCLDATAASPVITTAHLDTRPTALWLAGPPAFHQDGPQVRTAVHADGTVYAVFNGVRTLSGPLSGASTTSDVVVVRDDNWGIGGAPFTALVDPDGLAGMRVQIGVPLFWAPGTGTLGQERIFGTFAIAVHPANSDIVYLAWAQLESGVQTLHIQRSLNRGVAWSPNLLSISNGINAAIAISTAGKIALIYQQNTGSSPSDTWETHFRESTNGTTWSDTIVCSTPASTPPADGSLPYLGDYLELLAVGKNFYGVFCANNTPDPANFPATPAGAGNPNGAIFQRNVTSSAPWNLLDTTGTTVVGISIDPFLLISEEVSASADFYVRDWTDSPVSGDDGTEPSTHFDFWDFSDVWNQSTSSVAFPPDANDVPHTENAQAGADNYGFARIRRNALPDAGSGSTTVNAHFLVSEFGTGSNFVDNVYSDISDPDVTFPNADVSIGFAETDLGPLVTPPTTWNLAATSSDHLCLAVQISALGDPFAAPGLTAHAPGQIGTTLSVINDNNKAQRNLQVTPAAGGTGGIAHFGIVHNAATIVRDMILGIAVSAGGRPPEGTVIEVIGEKGVLSRTQWSAWGTVTLPAMQPGENRWVAVNLPVPASGTTVVTLTEMVRGRPVNGFSIGSQVSPLTTVIRWLLVYHVRVLKRMEAGFGIAVAGQGLKTLEELEHRKAEAEAFDFEEHVRVEEGDLRIEVDVRIRREGHGKRHDHRAGSAVGDASVDAKRYSAFIRAQADLLLECLAALGGADPFAIASAVAALDSATDTRTLTAIHASALNRFDAYMTMLQKSKGDRADILQMALWHRDLSLNSANLAALPDTPGVIQRLELFIDRSESRQATLSDYAALLATLRPLAKNIAAALGASAILDPLIAAFSKATAARAMQKAHRTFLMALAHYA
jgi:hypothetical protein